MKHHAIKKIGIFLIVLCTAAVTVAQQEFRRAGYFKGQAKNRIFTFEIVASSTKDSILKFARSRPHTQGQMTAVYFYQGGGVIPANGITLAKNLFQANNTLYETTGLSKWQFAYIRNFNGSEVFVNCNEKPSDDLCRK